jgi:hypothetical protein
VTVATDHAMVVVICKTTEVCNGNINSDSSYCLRVPRELRGRKISGERASIFLRFSAENGRVGRNLFW